MACMPVARDGDEMSCGAIIQATAKKTFVNCIPVARIGDPFAGKDCKGIIIEGAKETFAECIPVARVGDKGICEIHGSVTIVTGSHDTFAE